ncbi:MAG: winged helix-turn-helix domain-containing protein [Victivallaceae bacterium]|nr:winged helix-turn-helix domain-containing protein [Victivallaceae bacterium]
MNTNEVLLEENRIIHYLMSELNGEAESAAEEWENWANIIDQERVSRMLREMFTGMLVAERKCTEFESRNYINQLIKEYKAMNANEITVGKKYAVKVGRNEIEVTVTEKTERGWQVASASGRVFPVNSCERFVKCLEEPEAPKPQESAPKSKLSMLDAAAEILKGASYPMSAKELIAAMEEADIWKSPAGKTPANSLSAALNRNAEKENSRFQKTGKGMFALAAVE